MRALAWFSLGCLMLSLFACGDGDDGGPAVETIVRLIGPDGGTVELPRGGKVTIPAGALTQQVSIKITKLELDDVAALPSNLEASGKPYAFEPHGQIFMQPVKIEVPYEGEATDVRPLKLPNETADTSAWTTVFPSERDEDNRKLSMDATTFSVIVAARPRRDSGVITLPDGAVMSEDAGMMDSSVMDASAIDSGAGGVGGTAGADDDGGTAGETGSGGVGGSGGSVAMGLQWLRQFGSSSDSVQGVAVDGSGSVYIAGATAAALVTDELSAGLLDGFIRKYDASGVALWTRQFGTVGNDFATSVAVDSNDNVIVAGYAAGALNGQTAVGADDAFVRVYDTNGTELWTRQFGSIGDEAVFGVVVDGDRSIYVSGSTDYILAGQMHSGGQDAFVRKYDSAGTEQWTREFGTSGGDWGYAIAIDSNNNLFVTGTTQRTLAGQTSAGSNDAFVRAYDSAGTELWTRQFGTVAIEWGYAVTVNSSDHVVVAGTTSGTFSGQTSANSNDVFMRAYDSAGTELWTRQFGTAGVDEARCLAADGDGNVFVSGTIDGAALPGETSAGSHDVFVRAYNASGDESWTHQFGTRGSDKGNAVATGAGRRVIVGGRAGSIFPGQMSSNTVTAALVATFVW